MHHIAALTYTVSQRAMMRCTTCGLHDALRGCEPAAGCSATVMRECEVKIAATPDAVCFVEAFRNIHPYKGAIYKMRDLLWHASVATDLPLHLKMWRTRRLSGRKQIHTSAYTACRWCSTWRGVHCWCPLRRRWGASECKVAWSMVAS